MLAKLENERSPITPLSSKGWPKWAVFAMSLTGLFYLVYPSAGIFELIPDFIPIVGSLDEGAAAIALWYGYLELRNSRRAKRD